MRIAFIRPNVGDYRSADAMEPLIFAILKGLTPAAIEVFLIDERVEPIPSDLEADFIAMTVETFTARHAYALAAHFKDRGMPTVMGGYHPSFLPDESLEFAQAVVVGDAEDVWPQILEDAANGELGGIYQSGNQHPLNGIHYDRTIFKGKKYRPIHLVQYSRGCRFNCDFCSIRTFYGDSQRQRPIEDLVAEIRHLDPKPVFIVDDNLFVSKKNLKALLVALVPLKIRWFSQMTIDVAADIELLDLLKASGCIALFIGLESLDEGSLKNINKGWNLKWTDYATALRRLHTRGIMVYGSFVFGTDEDTEDDFDATLKFAEQAGMAVAAFNTLTPTPGSQLYARLKTEGRLLYKAWWLEADYHYGMATFIPSRMTPDQLEYGGWRIRLIFSGGKSILMRCLKLFGNGMNFRQLPLFLMANLVSRKEIRFKHRRAIGTRN